MLDSDFASKNKKEELVMMNKTMTTPTRSSLRASNPGFSFRDQSPYSKSKTSFKGSPKNATSGGVRKSVTNIHQQIFDVNKEHTTKRQTIVT